MPKQILKKTEPVLLPWSQTQVFSRLAAETFQIGTAQNFDISYSMLPTLLLSQQGSLQHSPFQLALKLSLYWTMTTIGSNPLPPSTPALREVVTNFEDPANNSGTAQANEVWQGMLPVSVAFPVGSLSLNPGSYLVVVRAALSSSFFQGQGWHVEAPCGYLFFGGSA